MRCQTIFSHFPPGASGDSNDLLPNPGSTGWSHNIPTDDGFEMDRIYSFDGENTALEVPQNAFNHTLHKRFTISAWLRHGFTQGVSGHTSRAKLPKEHIVCMSDGDGMAESI